MTLPSFAPFPNADVRQGILPEEWSVYLTTWNSLIELHLRLGDRQFSLETSESASLTGFLISFFHELVHDDSIIPAALPLRKRSFLVVHRVYSSDQVPTSLLSWPFLSDLCRAFSKSEKLRVLLGSLWEREGEIIEKDLQTAKSSIIKVLDSNSPGDAEDLLNKIVPLLKLSSHAGTYMLTGSDFLDSLCTAYPKVESSLRAKFTITVYLGLTALLEGSKQNFSLLSDHLYSLKTMQKKSVATQESLIADLVNNTPLLERVRDKATATEASRLKNFAAELSAYQEFAVARPKKLIRRKVEKRKGKKKAAEDEYDNDSFGDIHIHRMSSISQIQELFPDLGSGFVTRLLHEYNDDVESVTVHLLEDSFPSHLATADRGEQLPTASVSQRHLTPRTTPPPSERRNIFDNDEFDSLAVDTSRLHIGRKNKQLTADNILSDRKNAPSKSAILSALSAFDSDDDERDDTYDVEDVGGTVDSAAPGADGADADKNEEALFRAYTSNPLLFGREAETRRGKARAALKNETGLTDEAIEGWGIMMGRDPKRIRRLEAKFSAFTGQQTALSSTAWRDTPTSSGIEGVDDSGDGQRGGRGGGGLNGGRGRGRGRGGGGRGASNVAGPADDKGTQVSRLKKEASKGSRANHNRRDQRARKMARGGLAG